MATFPTLKSSITPPSVTTDTFFTRPVSEFDAGINASNAWVAEHHDKDTAQSLSDDEEEPDTETGGQPARALYDFEGKPEFRELSVNAGDELEILKEELDDGWSLAKVDGRVGLIPQTYYAFTADMLHAPSLSSHEQATNHGRTASSNSLTPRNSLRVPKTALPLIPQTTGEWSYLPSFRQSLLGGRSLNRFSSFVTTGAEDWVLNGTSADLPAEPSRSREPSYGNDGDEEENDKRSSTQMYSQSDRHFVEPGLIWRSKLPAFHVMVHSPSKRTSVISGSYTMYHVTSIFSLPESPDGMDEKRSPTRITVHRRFSHFVFLHTALTRRLPGIALPPLPEKQYAGRFSDEFVEARRGDLERYLNRVIRHTVARYAEVLTFFLSCENEIEWKRLVPYHLNAPPAGAAFYSQVYHPAFNLDPEDIGEAANRFESHVKEADKGVQGLRGIFGKVRNARLEMSNVQRLLSYGLLSLITSTPIAGGIASPGLAEDDEDEDDGQGRGRNGLMNNEGAWCWREDCEECLKLTKGFQKTAETLQFIADLHEDNAQRRQLVSHDFLKDVAHPSALYAPVIENHRATLARYTEATEANPPNDEVAGRCETVLNTTMAEFEIYHSQKVEDFKCLVTDHLDGEIEFYEQVLTRLRGAREVFNDPQYGALVSSPRQPSIYERELPNPRLVVPPLSQPCPHVFDSAPMRPVSVAIGGMSALLGGNKTSTMGTSRTSVLGKFW